MSEPPSDWHPADVVAALRKRGTSLRKIAKANGYSHIQGVLTRPWVGVEKLVAEALDLRAESIWPSRYTAEASREHAERLTRNKRAIRAMKRASTKGAA